MKRSVDGEVEVESHFWCELQRVPGAAPLWAYVRLAATGMPGRYCASDESAAKRNVEDELKSKTKHSPLFTGEADL